jgi:hypothetical protein
MFPGLQHELIVLPASAKQQIPARLQSAGIIVNPSNKPVPEKFKNAGIIYECKENKGTAEILIMDEAGMLPEHRSMAAILIFPGRSALGDWFSGTTDKILREKIHEVLCGLKSEMADRSA